MSYTITLTVEFSNSAQNFTVAVESFSFGVDDPPTSGSSSGGLSAGKPVFAPLAVNKVLDANTPRLYLAVATGVHLPTVILALTKAGSTQPDVTFTLNNVLATEITDSGNGHGGSFPTEQVTFVFGQLQLSSGGNEFNFDVTKSQTF